MADERN